MFTAKAWAKDHEGNHIGTVTFPASSSSEKEARELTEAAALRAFPSAAGVVSVIVDHGYSPGAESKE